MTSKKSWTSFIFTMLVMVTISTKCLFYFRKEKISDKIFSDQYIGDNFTGIDEEHSRQKRFLFFTSDRKLALPAGTALNVGFNLVVNPLRNAPVGYSGTLSLDYYFDIATDDLGFASHENPWFVIPFFYFNGGGPGDEDNVPGVNLAGGDRVVMFQVIEDIMETIGLLGKPCVQRAICEIFQGPLRNHGFLGEILKLLFSVSRAAYAEVRLSDYLAAEKAGKETGDCSFYHQLCFHSLFSNATAHPPKLIPVTDEVEGREKKGEVEEREEKYEVEEKEMDKVEGKEKMDKAEGKDKDELERKEKKDKGKVKEKEEMEGKQKDEVEVSDEGEEEVEGKKKDGLSRQKRFLYFTRERRITFPPDSLFFIIPTISVPLRGNIPVGLAQPVMTTSIVLQLILDDLGLTSEENPFGIWEIFEDDLGEDIPVRRRPVLTKRSDSRFPGGDREMLYAIVEDAIRTAGLVGKACLLRAICEMFQYPLDNHGFFGEVLELFFSASLAPDADKRLPEYVAAERAGKTTGKCFAYHDDCPHSLFTNPMDSNIIDEDEMKKDFSEERRQELEGQSLLNPSNMVAVLIDFLESWL